MNITEEQITAGQAVYTPRTLAIYDLVVLSISNRFIWRCPSHLITAHYNRHVSANHLDVGVGSGYFLDHCQFPVARPCIALMDLNQSALEFTARRIGRYLPATLLRNVLAPIPFEGEPFDSVGINYLLHCLPGSIASKTVVFDHLKPLMNPGAVIFGSTLLHDGVQRGWMAQRLMAIYNRKGIFSNREDELDGLRQALEQRFHDVEISISGCAALFSARV